MIREAFAKFFRRSGTPAAIRQTISRADELAEIIAPDFMHGGPATSIRLLLGLESPESSMKVSALSACVRLISGNVSKLPFPVFRMVGEEDRKRDRGHNVDRLLNVRPNSWQTGLEFRKMLTAHVALYGNGYAIKQLSGAVVDELIPVHPSKMSVVKPDLFSAPVYDVSISPSVKRRYLASEILHLRDLTLDGVLGLSRIQQAQQGISLALAAETYATAYFANGAEPGTVLETDKNLTDEQRLAIKQGYIEAHQGPNRAHLPVVAEGGLKVKSIGATNKDSQMLELRSFQVEDIARMYGVPSHLLNMTEKQTSYGTGVEQMAIGFLQFNLLDWLVMWETAVKRDLLAGPSDANAFAEHLVDALLRADLKTRMDAYAVAIQNGILSRNEARKKENLIAYPEGDKYLYPANMAVAGVPIAAAPAVRASFPSDDPRRAWKTRIRSARRAVEEREAV